MSLTKLPNEIYDEIFAYLEHMADIFSICATHSTFKASAQRRLFKSVQLPVERYVELRKCKLFLRTIKASPELAVFVRCVQLDISEQRIDEQHLIPDILGKLPQLEEICFTFPEGPGNSVLYQAQIQGLYNGVKNTCAPKVVIRSSCPIVVSKLMQIPSAKEIVIRPECVMNPPSYHARHPAYSWEEPVILPNLCGIDLSSFRVNPLEISKICMHAINLRRFNATVPRSVLPNAIVDALTPVCGTLQSLELQHPSRCSISAPTHRTQADFSTFSALKSLRVPSTMWFPTVQCGFNQREDTGFAWKHGNRPDISALLPPSLETLDIRFAWPTGIFAMGGNYQRQFLALPDALQAKGFHWIMELTASAGCRHVRLIEEDSHADCDNGGATPFWGHPRRQPLAQRAFLAPRAVKDVFDAAGVTLDIKVYEREEWKRKRTD